jgi:hypothetical protein
MDWSQLLPDVERVLAALEDAQAQVAADVKEGLKQGDQLREAARTIGEASSGSWVGWHSRMYYGNYEEPPVADTWNAEWGGLEPFSDNWHERTLPVVQRAIEDRAGVRLADTAHCADRVREVCQPLQQELVTVLSPVCDMAAFAKEAELLAKLEKIDWIMPPDKFVRAMAPGNVMSRDTHALTQGLQAPLHLEVIAAIATNATTLTTSQEFLTNAIRLARQVRTKLNAMPAEAPVEAPALGQGFNPRLQRQLRQRSLALFTVLAIGIVAAEVWLLRTIGQSSLAAAAIAIAGTLAVGGIYAWLVDRAHVRWALAAGAGVLGAIAALDQILGHFLR